MGNYTVQLLDTKYGRVLLDNVVASSPSAAATAALAAPPVSGDNSDTDDYTAGGTVDQALILAVSGTLADGTTPYPSPTSLPVNPAPLASPEL